MILCLDIGNTRVKGVYFESDTVFDGFSFPTPKNINDRSFETELLSGINRKITDSVYSSVVPGLNSFTESALTQASGIQPLCISSMIKLPFSINYDDPAKLGADRICTAAAAVRMFPSSNIIVVDAGTAVTFCVILSEGIYDGGVITSGYGIAIDALGKQASQLFNIAVNKPERVSAHSTEQALQSGFYYGWISLIEGITSRLQKEYHRDFILVLTGGAIKALLPDMNDYHYDEILLFKGMKVLFDLNR